MRKFLLIALLLTVLPWTAVALCADAPPKVKIEIVAPKAPLNADSAKDPGVVKFREILAIEEAGDADKALEGYRQFVKDFKGQPIPYYYIAKILIGKGDTAGALEAIKVADTTELG